ncbi:MAG: hypothetical protein ACYDDA_05805 [Acidiferrobacteraceae bacterium]
MNEDYIDNLALQSIEANKNKKQVVDENEDYEGEEDEQIEPSTNPYSKGQALETLERFETNTQKDPSYWEVGEIKLGMRDPSFLERMNEEPSCGWAKYIQEKFVDRKGKAGEYQITFYPNFVLNNRGKVADPKVQKLRIEPSLESIETRQESYKINTGSQPIILGEDEFSKKLKESALESIMKKDETEKKVKEDTFNSLKQMKDLIIPENSKDSSNALLEMVKIFANNASANKKVSEKDDFDKMKDFTNIIAAINGGNKKDDGKDKDAFYATLLDMTTKANQAQMKFMAELHDKDIAHQREVNRKEELHRQELDKIKETATKPQSLLGQINDLKKFGEMAEELGYKKGEGGEQKEENWKDKIANEIPNLLQMLPMLIDKGAQIWASRNQAQPAVNPNANFNPNLNYNNNMAMLSNNPYIAPAPLINNMPEQNTAPMPTPAPAPPVQQQETSLQLTPLALLQLALLKDADRSFDKFRDWKSTKDLNGNLKKLEKLRETVEAYYENVKISFMDINPNFEDDDIASQLQQLANITKSHYPAFFEKINSIVGQAWIADLVEYIKNANDDSEYDDSDDNDDNDINNTDEALQNVN